jgi:isopentenyl diphosphate isomerase/L-lactate dehydrogenase-like FMN-dependent dehydrogenase
MSVNKYRNVEDLQEDSIFSYQNIQETIDTLEEMKLLMNRRRNIAQDGMEAFEYSAQGMQYEAELEYLHEEFERLEELIFQATQLKFNFYPEYCTEYEKQNAQSGTVTFTDHSGGKTGDDAVVGTATFKVKKTVTKDKSVKDIADDLRDKI